MDQREQATAAPDGASSPAKSVRGPKAGTDSAKRGGRAMAEQYGRDFYVRIGSKGGRAMRDRHGPEFYAEIGKRGGQSTRDTRGQEFYASIGRLGGQRGRGVPKRRASDRLYEAQHTADNARPGADDTASQ
jgi:uncharacterized protein